MKIKNYILSFFIALGFIPLHLTAQNKTTSIHFDFYGDSVDLQYDKAFFIDFTEPLSELSLQEFNKKISETDYLPVIRTLLSFKERYNLDDWLYYQLIRKTAQQLSPKADNYIRYTLYKWFFLTRSGYDAMLNIHEDKILFYVQCDENIYNIPYRIKNGKQYVCLNYHDYGTIDFAQVSFHEVALPMPEASKGFSYKVTHLPHFRPGDYMEKDLVFMYIPQLIDRLFTIYDSYQKNHPLGRKDPICEGEPSLSF